MAFRFHGFDGRQTKQGSIQRRYPKRWGFVVNSTLGESNESSIPHSLGKQEARHRIECLSTHWRDKYGVSVCWEGDSASSKGSVKGVAFDAKLTISETRVEAQGTDPGFLMRTMATAYIKNKLSHYLDSIQESRRA